MTIKEIIKTTLRKYFMKTYLPIMYPLLAAYFITLAAQIPQGSQLEYLIDTAQGMQDLLDRGVRPAGAALEEPINVDPRYVNARDMYLRSLVVTNSLVVNGQLFVGNNTDGQYVLKAGDSMSGDLTMLNQKGVVFNDAQSGSLALTAPPLVVTPGDAYVLALPISQGLNNQILSTDGQNPAQLSWKFITQVVTETPNLFGDVTGPFNQNTVSTVCGVAACNLVNTYSKVLNATSSNVPNTLVLRDGTGSFATNAVILSGNPALAYFNGSSNQPLLNVTIGGSSVSFASNNNITNLSLGGASSGNTVVTGNSLCSINGPSGTLVDLAVKNFINPTVTISSQSSGGQVVIQTPVHYVDSESITLGSLPINYNSGKALYAIAVAENNSGGALTANPVYCDFNNGFLYRFTSAQRYKTAIKDLESSTEDFHALRPVSYARVDDPLQYREYGFIADEVNDHFPEIVNVKNGQIESYNTLALAALHLAEFQKDHKLLLAALGRIHQLEARIAELEKPGIFQK